MKTIIIAGFVIEPMAAATDGIQPFKIKTVDRSKDAIMHYRTIASEFNKKTGYPVKTTGIIIDTDGEKRFKFDCAVPETPDYSFNPDEQDADIAGLAKWFGVESAFLQGMHDRLTDKNDMFMACQLFDDGILAYDIATGDQPIDVNAIRESYIAGIRKQKATAKKMTDYYQSCITISITHSGGQYRETAFIKDGRLVAFAQFTRDHRGGIYAANNKVQKIPGWNAHECVAKFRTLNKQAYKAIKRQAYAEPAETFKFDQRTVRK